MSSVKARALEMMNNLESWKKIIKGCNAGAKTYEALRKFLSTTGPKAYDDERNASSQLAELLRESEVYDTRTQNQEAKLTQLRETY